MRQYRYRPAAASGAGHQRPVRPGADCARPSLQNKLHLSPDEIATLSPIRLAPRPGTRLITTVGGAETIEFRRQNAEFAAAGVRSWATSR